MGGWVGEIRGCAKAPIPTQHRLPQITLLPTYIIAYLAKSPTTATAHRPELAKTQLIPREWKAIPPSAKSPLPSSLLSNSFFHDQILTPHQILNVFSLTFQIHFQLLVLLKQLDRLMIMSEVGPVLVLVLPFESLSVV